jgi:hypothetical protein
MRELSHADCCHCDCCVTKELSSGLHCDLVSEVEKYTIENTRAAPVQVIGGHLPSIFVPLGLPV